MRQSVEWFPANSPPPTDARVLAYSDIDGEYRVALFHHETSRWVGGSYPWHIDWWTHLPSPPVDRNDSGSEARP